MKLSNASCLIVNESFIYLLDTNAPLTQRNRSKRYYVLTKSVDSKCSECDSDITENSNVFRQLDA